MKFFKICLFLLDKQYQAFEIKTLFFDKFCSFYDISYHPLQSTKILLVPQKYEMIMVQSNDLCQYCYHKIRLFTIAPCKVVTVNFLCFSFAIISLLLSFSFFSKVIVLSTIVIVIVVALKGDRDNFSFTFSYRH